MPLVAQRTAFVAFLAALGLVFAGCGGIRDEFLGPRVVDSCDGEWPVCDTHVGCFVGDRSYVEGIFPGQNHVGIRVFEPSTVTVSFYLFEVSGQGEETAIDFNEDSCRARVRTVVTGRTFFAEADKAGYVSRSADLSGVGDHLIDWQSDARAKYLAKIDVVPLRLKDQASQ